MERKRGDGTHAVLSLETNGLDNSVGNLLDRDLVVLPDCQIHFPLVNKDSKAIERIKGENEPLRITGSISLYSRSVQTNSLARSRE
jgi:hypothetical protein